jgi:hypothetical protein
LTLLHVRDRLNVLLMAVLCTVPQALDVSPNALLINAQRVARFDHYRTRNCLPPKQLHRGIQ